MDSAEHFNFLMIEETGVVGVHFPSTSSGQAPGYVRYAVCADVAAMRANLDAAFQKAKVSYI